MLPDLTYYTDVLGIVGDILRVRASDVGFGDLAIVENTDGQTSLAQVIELQGNIFTALALVMVLQVLLTDLPITFDASATFDPDGDPLTYQWDFGDGSPPVEVQSDGNAVKLDPEGYGTVLTRQLFGEDDIKASYLRARTAAESTDAFLRLRVAVDPSAEELHAARWELLRDPETGAPLATSPKTLLSRWSAKASSSIPAAPTSSLSRRCSTCTATCRAAP